MSRQFSDRTARRNGNDDDRHDDDHQRVSQQWEWERRIDSFSSRPAELSRAAAAADWRGPSLFLSDQFNGIEKDLLLLFSFISMLFNPFESNDFGRADYGLIRHLWAARCSDLSANHRVVSFFLVQSKTFRSIPFTSFVVLWFHQRCTETEKTFSCSATCSFEPFIISLITIQIQWIYSWWRNEEILWEISRSRSRILDVRRLYISWHAR